MTMAQGGGEDGEETIQALTIGPIHAMRSFGARANKKKLPVSPPPCAIWSSSGELRTEEEVDHGRDVATR